MDNRTLISGEQERLFESFEAGAKPGVTTGGRESYDERLNHILEAATNVIARVGYGHASMRAVAKAAQVSLAGMYHYFDSKEKMLFLIQFRTFNSLLQNLREKLHGVEEPVEQLRVMVRSHIGYFATDMAALKVCSHELDALTGSRYEDLRHLRHQYYELTRAIIERVFQSRAPGGGLDEHVATMALFGTLNWLYRWYRPGPDYSVNGLANQITRLFLTGIIGLKPAADGSASSAES